MTEYLTIRSLNAIPDAGTCRERIAALLAAAPSPAELYELLAADCRRQGRPREYQPLREADTWLPDYRARVGKRTVRVPAGTVEQLNTLAAACGFQPGALVRYAISGAAFEHIPAAVVL